MNEKIFSTRKQNFKTYFDEFVILGTFVKHSSEVDENAEVSAPLMMDVNGDTARYTSMSEEVKKPQQQQQRHSHGHGKGRHGRKGGRRN